MVWLIPGGAATILPPLPQALEGACLVWGALACQTTLSLLLTINEKVSLEMSYWQKHGIEIKPGRRGGGYAIATYTGDDEMFFMCPKQIFYFILMK